MMRKTVVLENTTIERNTKRICFEDSKVKKLRIELVSTLYEAQQERILETGRVNIISQNPIMQKGKNTHVFELSEITVDKLIEYRKSERPSFVYKADNKYYYCQIPYQLNLVGTTFLGQHLCGCVGHECNRLSAASDEDGGCAKVRGCSRGIERYPWITKGYETFNTSTEAFIVLECEHYEKMKPSQPFYDEEYKEKDKNKRIKKAIVVR